MTTTGMKQKEHVSAVKFGLTHEIFPEEERGVAFIVMASCSTEELVSSEWAAESASLKVWRSKDDFGFSCRQLLPSDIGSFLAYCRNKSNANLVTWNEVKSFDHLCWQAEAKHDKQFCAILALQSRDMGFELNYARGDNSPGGNVNPPLPPISLSQIEDVYAWDRSRQGINVKADGKLDEAVKRAASECASLLSIVREQAQTGEERIQTSLTTVPLYCPLLLQSVAQVIKKDVDKIFRRHFGLDWLAGEEKDGTHRYKILGGAG